MLTVLIISLREFLEVFLIIGVFLSLSRTLKTGLGKEILTAALVGIAFSLSLATLFFIIGDRARMIFTEKNTDLLEGYLMTFSGFFVAYVIFTLHKFFVLDRSKMIIKTHQKLQQKVFDVSLFASIVLFIVREGFEIALFTATTSLFSRFIENFAGLLIGFICSALIGTITFFMYSRFPIGKIYKYTEYLIVLLGAGLVKNGLSELAEFYFHINLSTIMPLNFYFLPHNSTYIGHFINTLFGIEQNFSVIKLAIMLLYIAFIYQIFLKKNHFVSHTS